MLLILTDGNIPSSLSRLTKLQKCALFGNKLSTWTNVFIGCVNGVIVRIYVNVKKYPFWNTGGTIPSELFSSMSELNMLCLEENHLGTVLKWSVWVVVDENGGAVYWMVVRGV